MNFCNYGGRMVSILSSYDKVPEGYRKVYIRMRSIERSELQSLIQEMDRPSLARLKEVLREKVNMLYVINQRENTSEISYGHECRKFRQDIST